MTRARSLVVGVAVLLLAAACQAPTPPSTAAPSVSPSVEAEPPGSASPLAPEAPSHVGPSPVDPGFGSPLPSS